MRGSGGTKASVEEGLRYPFGILFRGTRFWRTQRMQSTASKATCSCVRKNEELESPLQTAEEILSSLFIACKTRERSHEVNGHVPSWVCRGLWLSTWVSIKCPSLFCVNLGGSISSSLKLYFALLYAQNQSPTLHTIKPATHNAAGKVYDLK